MPSTLRNPVPLDAPSESASSFARCVADRFDGVSVEGMAVPVPPYSEVEDRFGGCAQGAAPFLNMSDFLLSGSRPQEHGASR